MGPTAGGKTALAIELVQKFNLEIISVDSAMIYQGMDIGTAKPCSEELELAPHRLIDICSPEQTYSVASFCLDAKRHIQEIHAKGKVPLLVGGTMMYFNALVHGLAPLPTSSAKTRKKWQDELSQYGLDYLYNKLLEVDPATANKLHHHDSQRILRALEVYEESGRPISDWLAQAENHCLPYTVYQFAIEEPERAILHKRIEKRFNDMIYNNFIAEVETLMKNPNNHVDLPAMRSVGYRQAWEYLSGKIDRETMIERAIIATRQLAKRQLTWLRNWKTPLQCITLKNREKLYNQLAQAECLVKLYEGDI